MRLFGIKLWGSVSKEQKETAMAKKKEPKKSAHELEVEALQETVKTQNQIIENQNTTIAELRLRAR